MTDFRTICILKSLPFNIEILKNWQLFSSIYIPCRNIIYSVGNFNVIALPSLTVISITFLIGLGTITVHCICIGSVALSERFSLSPWSSARSVRRQHKSFAEHTFSFSAHERHLYTD